MTYTSPFRYFADPHHFAYYNADKQDCVICHQSMPGYPVSIDTISDESSHVCETCLANGRISEFDAITNSGRFEVLSGIGLTKAIYRMTREYHPQWSDEQVKSHAMDRTLEIETRTPQMESWQDIYWPVHCDDYLRYIRGIGKPDCDTLSGTGDGKSFLALHLSERQLPAKPQEAEQEVDSLWSAMREGSPIDFSESYWTEFYLFQCLRCDKYVIEWDAG